MEHKSTILIVDDDPVGRDTLEGVLYSQGYRLAFAGTGPETLAKAAELIPDLILLDVMMPAMDGFEVCRRLRADKVLADVPIIMVTALDDRDSCLRGIEAGADDFVTKPFDRLKLRARVQTITRLNRYRRLLAERARFEWAVEHADDGYVLLGKGDRVLYANPQARLYLGLPPSNSGRLGPVAGSAPDAPTFLEPAGKQASKQHRLEPQGGWTRWAARSVEDSTSSLCLVRSESEMANAFWLQVEAVALPVEPGRCQVVRLRDVTAELPPRRDMRGLYETIRYKMRAPLMGMITGSELLVQHASTLSAKEVVERSTAALIGTRRLHSTIADILAYLDASGSARPGGPRLEFSRFQTFAAESGSGPDIESVRMTCPQALSPVHVAHSAQAMELALWEIMEEDETGIVAELVLPLEENGERARE